MAIKVNKTKEEEFNIGDIVKIINKVPKDERDDPGFLLEMYPTCGQEGVIIKISDDKLLLEVSSLKYDKSWYYKKSWVKKI